MRPTGLLDPEIELRPMEFMVDDIMKNISEVVEKNERILITTITKRSSEELTEYLLDNWVKVKYLHSEVDTLDRLEILKELRLWKIDVIVWVNLLREGLDLPEVSKICILDADKQGFLRSESSLIQIIWRAARNQNGKVYMYCEKVKLWWEKWIDLKKLNQEYDNNLILVNNQVETLFKNYDSNLSSIVLNFNNMIENLKITLKDINNDKVENEKVSDLSKKLLDLINEIEGLKNKKNNIEIQEIKEEIEG